MNAKLVDDIRLEIEYLHGLKVSAHKILTHYKGKNSCTVEKSGSPSKGGPAGYFPAVSICMGRAHKITVEMWRMASIRFTRIPFGRCTICG